jgi:hypothetical protein
MTATPIPQSAPFREDEIELPIPVAVVCNGKPKIVNDDLAMRKRKAPVRSKKALSTPPKTPTEKKSRSVRKPTDLKSHSRYETAAASVAITIERRR